MGGIERWPAWVIAIAAALFFGLVWVVVDRLLRPINRAVSRPLDPESRFIVRLSDTEVACERPDGKVERVAWDDLQRVDVMTTSDGPMSPDVFWLLAGKAGGCLIPQGATGERELLPRLQALPGFDNAMLIKAMGSTTEARFLCWQRTPESAL